MITYIIYIGIALIFWAIGRDEYSKKLKELSSENYILRSRIEELQSNIIVMRSQNDN
jgi:hypothetical protein